MTGTGVLGTDVLGTGVLGEEYIALLPWFVLALGAALVLGTVLAMVRPRTSPQGEELARPPAGRSAVMIGIGALAAVWGLASLVG